jgi:tRNA(Arg) A34 adenosine deaminase TadA
LASGFRRNALACLRKREAIMADDFLDQAIAEAEAGWTEGGIPIGSVLVHRGRIVATPSLTLRVTNGL